MAGRKRKSAWDTALFAWLRGAKAKQPRRRRATTPKADPAAVQAETQAAAAELVNVAHEVLENSTLTNARALTAALRGRAAPGTRVTTTTTSTTDVGGDPSQPAAPRGPGASPPGWGQTHRRPRPAPTSPTMDWRQRMFQHLQRPGTSAAPPPVINLPASQPGAPGGPSQPLPPQTKQFTGWLGKIVGLFQQWHKAAGGGKGGHGGGWLGSLMGGDWRRHHPGFSQMAGGLFSGGAGQGGGGIANALGGQLLQGGLGGISRLGGMLGGAGGGIGAAGGALAMGASVVGGAVALAGAFAGLCRISYMLADAQAESMRGFAAFNAKIAGSFIKADFQDRLRMFDQAAINSSSTAALVESLDLLKDDLMPIRALMTDALNYIGVGIATTLRSIYRGLAAWVPGMAKLEKAIRDAAEKEQKAGRHALAGHFGDVISGKIYNQKPNPPAGKKP